MDLEQQFSVDRVEARSVTLTDVDIDGWASVSAGTRRCSDSRRTSETSRRRSAAARSGRSSPRAGTSRCTGTTTRDPAAGDDPVGTLRLSEDTRGLRVEADLDEDHYMTPTLRSMIRRGDVTGMSFGFVAGRGNQILEERNGRPHRI
jgi:hypothetical protein